MSQTFEKWLTTGDLSPFLMSGEAGKYYTILRCKKSDNIDYLFSQEHNEDTSVEMGGDFVFCGLFDRKTNLVYGCPHTISMALPDKYRGGSMMNLLSEFTKSVRNLVMKKLNYSKESLHVKALSSNGLCEQLSSERGYKAKYYANAVFIADKPNPNWLEDVCDYTHRWWDEESLLLYLNDPEGYTEEEAEAYIATNQEHLLFQFLVMEARKNAYEEISSNPHHSAQYIKRILTAMNHSSAAAVTVTICRDGKTFSFENGADLFRVAPDSFYPIRKLDDPKVRLGFQSAFKDSPAIYGNAGFSPIEIQSISDHDTLIYKK